MFSPAQNSAKPMKQSHLQYPVNTSRSINSYTLSHFRMDSKQNTDKLQKKIIPILITLFKSQLTKSEMFFLFFMNLMINMGLYINYSQFCMFCQVKFVSHCVEKSKVCNKLSNTNQPNIQVIELFTQVRLINIGYFLFVGKRQKIRVFSVIAKLILFCLS